MNPTAEPKPGPVAGRRLERHAGCWLRAAAQRAAWSLAVAAVGASATQQSVTPGYEIGKLPVAVDAVGTLGAELFGDKVNLYNGAFSFEHTELSLPGNNALPVALVRTWNARKWWLPKLAMGDWDISTPRIEGTFATDTGFIPMFGSAATRCSGFNAPPDVSIHDGWAYSFQQFDSWQYWQGTFLHIPGRGNQEILRRQFGFSAAPGDGNSYPLLTRELWQISCLPALRRGAGQGFVAVSPDGTRYVFDWMVSRASTPMRKGDAVLARSEWLIMATRVTDRFGNWVAYHYHQSHPDRLQRIEASDGRTITLHYQGARVSSVTDGSRTWHYTYDGQGDLAQVGLPDGSAWSFNLRGLIYTENIRNEDYTDCDSPPSAPSGQFVGTMRHPSGTVGTFTSVFVVQGRSGVQRACTYHPGTDWSWGWTNGAMYHKATYNQALTEKRIEGPGLAPMTWRYNVGDGYTGDWAPCTDCPDRKVTILIKPDGSQDRHHFGIRWRVNEGQLLRIEEGWDGQQAAKTTDFRYRSAAGQAYPAQFGTSVNFQSDQISYRNLPQDQRLITQQGVTFRWEAAASAQGFDALARPLTVTKSSSLGYSRTETTVYRDNPVRWVMGQIYRVVADGRIPQAFTYDAMDLPKSRSAFGRDLESYAYHDNGSLARVADAAGHTTWLHHHHRGQPQLVVFADGHSESQVVNNLGKPTRITNAAGTSHDLAHDAMGRLRRIDYPSGDPVAYHPTLIDFEQVWHDEFGLPAGHWRQTRRTGNGHVTRYFDALWRERLRWERDITRAHDTSSFVETRYDHAGRKTFVSYPERTFTQVDQSRPGIHFSHDALGRVTRELRDSEHGPLERITQHVAPFQRQVRNERGFWTTYRFQAYDEPSEDLITHIWMPHEVFVGIQRDNFGKALAISRAGGNGAGPAVTRRYVYDLHERLCKTIEPEAGATVQQYDAAGNLAWTASGLPLLDPHQCQRDQVPEARQISHGYDSRNRLTSTRYGDGSPGITRSYTPDGLPATVSSDGVTWTYGYYNRRVLRSEHQSVWGWSFHWSLNENGHVAGLQDPWGWMPHDPDALGRPTRAGPYAHSATYHPNGALAQFTYGNGQVHATSLNQRGLPHLWRDTGVLQYRYHYDAAGNVTRIADEFEGLAGVSMQYDGLDRLTVADGRWGFGNFQYDAQDNLIHSRVGNRVLTHHIDPATHRLSAITGSQTLGIGYDANGNVSQRGGQAYSFDIGNRLRHASGKASYLYDGHGRRHWIGRTDGSGRLSAYSRSGQLLFSWDSTHGHTRYVTLGKRLVAEVGEGGTTTYLHTDALGSPVARSNQAGQVLNRTRYEPYGGVAEGHVPSGVGYTGHVNDADTGLVYMQQRYYEPLAGRFLSVDPVTTDAKTGSSFNRYVYGNNNPYKYKDPDGRFGVLAFLATPPGLAVAAVAVVGHYVLPGREAREQSLGNLINSQSGSGKPSTLTPGPNAGDSIPARGPGRDFTPGERQQVNDIGNATGCHTCGATSPGTKSGNWVPDHQPPSSQNTDGGQQRLYPQCVSCSRTQGGEANAANTRGGKTEEPKREEPKTTK